jgi:hypothetical protein
MTLYKNICIYLDLVTEISKFLSDDGNEFNTKEETIDHEKKINFCEEFIQELHL